MGGGTSAATPTWASVGSRLNDVAMGKTSKPLGFLNPLLYKIYGENKAAFPDIIKGDNKCTEEGCAASCKGFEATKGWDPVTGLARLMSLNSKNTSVSCLTDKS